MTFDVIALCRRQPDREAVLAALSAVLSAAEPGLGVRPDPSGAVVRLVDAGGQPLCAVEGPILVQVRGEIERLLGPVHGVEEPVWWVEARAVSGREDGAGAARRFADRLVAELGGAVWTA